MCCKPSASISQPVRLAGGWWLVLVCSERKVLLAGYWWMVCCERKVLLAGGWYKRWTTGTSQVWTGARITTWSRIDDVPAWNRKRARVVLTLIFAINKYVKSHAGDWGSGTAAVFCIVLCVYIWWSHVNNEVKHVRTRGAIAWSPVKSNNAVAHAYQLAWPSRAAVSRLDSCRVLACCLTRF
jgi:hypothetical protein